MSDEILAEGAGFGDAVAAMIEAELAADMRKNGIVFTRNALPERRDVVTKGAVSLLVITIIGRAVGGVLQTYATRLIDLCHAKLSKQREHLPLIEVKVLYDGREKKTFFLPHQTDAAKRYLAGE